MKEEKEALIDKIRKLLEKSESAKQLGNQAEAEAFAMKAQDMMIKYQVQADELRQASGGKMQMKLEVWNYLDLTNRHESDWVKNLIFSLCIGNLCRTVWLTIPWKDPNNPDYKWKDGDMAIMGQPENIEMTRYMLDQFVVRARMMAKESFRKYDGLEKRNTYIRGFLRGFSLGLREKLRENLATYTKEENSTSLMIVNQSAVVSRFVETKFPHLGKAKGSSLSGAAGTAAGKEAGRNTTIHRGLSGGKATQTRRIG